MDRLFREVKLKTEQRLAVEILKDVNAFGSHVVI